MREGIIRRINGAPDFSALPLFPIDQRLWCGPVEITAGAQIAWSEEALHLRLSAREAAIRAEETGALGMPCEDSCLEFFFQPQAGDLRYFNLEFNLNACLYLGLGGTALTRLVPDDAEAIFCPAARRTSGGWEIVYRVPFDFIRRFFPSFSPRPGDCLRANFYKCGDRTPVPHYLAWNPVAAAEPNFHRPQDFGMLTFGA